MPGTVEEAPNGNHAGGKLSAEQFQAWKEQKERSQREAAAEAAARRREDILAGRIPVEHLTGRELYEFHPELFEGY